MKKILFITALFLCTLAWAGDGNYKIYKTNGDIITCNSVKVWNGIEYKLKGEKKTSLKPEEVLYYTKNDSEKYIVPPKGVWQSSNFRGHYVIIENDSVMLTSAMKEMNGLPFEDYYILRKKGNDLVTDVRKNIQAIEMLKKYFGGHCAEFDKMVTAKQSKFTKAKFNDQAWYDLIYYYRWNCN